MIKLVDVDFFYPTGVHAIKNVSFEIGRGDFLTVMGGSGAGKTTLLKLLNGLLKPSSGKIFVDGVETVRVSVAELSKKVGILFQNPDRQFFCGTVEKEIIFGLKNFGFSEEMIQERLGWALSYFNLEAYKYVSPFNLSEGEKKRVALASVVAWNPDYLVLDEPTLGQDFVFKERLRSMLADLNSQGITLILASHDIEFVADLNCKIVVMADGRIIGEGLAEEVLTDGNIISKGKLDFPQLVKAFKNFDTSGLPKVFSVERAKDAILKKFEEIKR